MNIVELCSSAGTRPQRLSQASVLRWRAGEQTSYTRPVPGFRSQAGAQNQEVFFCVRYRSIHGNRDEYS